MFVNLSTMNLHIAPNRSINQIQEEFNRTFPYLKLEFFYKKSGKSNYSVSQLVSPTKNLGELHKSIIEGDIEIGDEIKVIDLENTFRNEFGLAVQVFRQSGSIWLETTFTDSWTLYQQNKHGQEISTTKNTDVPEDYDLTRGQDH